MNTRNLIYRNHNLTLTGNVLSGDTFPVKEAIKLHLGGKWDSTRKAWIVDMVKTEDFIKRDILHLTAAPVTPEPQAITGGASGWCNKCHTYCYGDCDAH